MPRQGRKEDVLTAAVTLFSQKGYHGTTVREIAEESGMLSGSLYAHISSKEDLLYAIVHRAAEQFLAAITPLTTPDLPAAQRLRKAMRAHLKVMAASREAATVFMHEWKALTGERRTQIATMRKEYEAAFATIIRQGVDSGEFRPLDHKFARLAVLSAVNWLYQWYDPNGPLGPDQVADKFADLLLHGFLQEGGAHA